MTGHFQSAEGWVRQVATKHVEPLQMNQMSSLRLKSRRVRCRALPGNMWRDGNVASWLHDPDVLSAFITGPGAPTSHPQSHTGRVPTCRLGHQTATPVIAALGAAATAAMASAALHAEAAATHSRCRMPCLVHARSSIPVSAMPASKSGMPQRKAGGQTDPFF